MTTDRPWSEGQPDPSPGLTEPVRAIRDAIPTSRHARMLFDMVKDLVGDEAVIETAGGSTRYALFRRELPGAGGIVPWPLLRLGIAGRLSAVVILMKPPGAPDEPPPRPGAPPRLRGLGPGEVEIHDGPCSITVTYGDDGRWIETSRSESPDSLKDALPFLSRKSARPVELLAEYVAGVDTGRHGPGRVLCPAPVPSVQGVWNCGLVALREALFAGRIPETARWAIADGYEGTAISWGATKEDARSAWDADVKHAPRSPDTHEHPAENAPDEPPLGVITLRGPSADIPWPDPGWENTPAVLIPLQPNLRPPSRWGSWVRLVGGFGGTFPALLRRDADGFMLVGDALADRIDLHGLEGELDAAEAEQPDVGLWSGDPDRVVSTVVYRVVDDRTHEPVPPSVVEARRGRLFEPRTLDGDHLRWRVVRQRRLG